MDNSDNIDYQKLGFKCGIEIHRRLNTKKLFCNCASTAEEAPKSEINRKLRATAGELGIIDPAALHEFQKGKEFIYKIYPVSTCLVEMDEEPPHEVNPNALEISLLVSKMLSANIPDEIHFMRKTVIDGSNTSGFQRTAIVGVDGKLKTSIGSVGITNISLEEESAQILEKRNSHTLYGLDRLGIPLVEIGTSPDIKTPEHAKETAEKIGMLLKSTGKVMRGIGTIRQDVNISIKDGARIEIKGAQDLKMIPELIRQEVLRQISLLKLKEYFKKRNFKKSEAKIIDATSVFKNTSSKILAGKEIYAIKIEKLSGIFKQKLNSFRTLGNEVAGYAREKSKVKGILHSDEDLKKYKIEKEFSGLRKILSTKGEDLVVIVAADKKTAKKALESVVRRVNRILDGVLEETRRALPNGDSEFMRPLPGAARMYPETDVAPIPISEKDLKKIILPETFDKKLARLKKEIGFELANQIIASDYLDIFEEISKKYKVDKKNAAVFFTNTLPNLKSREGIEPDKIKSCVFLDIFSLVESGKIKKEHLPEIILKNYRTGDPISKIFSLAPKISEKDIEIVVRKIISCEKTDKINVIVGEAIKELKGRASGKEISDVVKKVLKN